MTRTYWSPASFPPGYRARSVVVSPASVPRVIASDPDDDHVLAAAVTGAADLIASGDKRDLLPLGSYLGIPIVTAREALQRIETGGQSGS